MQIFSDGKVLVAYIPGQYTKGTVYVVKLIGRRFKVVLGCLERGGFALGIENLGINQIGQDGIQVIIKLMSGPDPFADIIELS